MPFNSTDFTQPPFANGLMDLTEEEVLYVQSELKEIATSIGVEFYTYDVLLGYNTGERWTAGEWINGDTAEYCFNYAPVVEEQPVPEEPVEEPPATEE